MLDQSAATVRMLYPMAITAARQSAAGAALLEDERQWGEVLLRGIVNAVLNALDEGGYLRSRSDPRAFTS